MTDSVRPSRRMHLCARAGAAAAVLALAATGCSSGAGNADADTGAPGSVQSAPADATPTSTGSAGSTATSNASPEPTSTAFVPASSEGPAQNVPVPEMPEAAKEQTQEGLEAALEYWWEAEHYLKLTGDAKPMQRVSMVDCVVCQDLISNWPLAFEDGVWADVEPADLNITVSNLESDDHGTLLFTATEHASTVYAPGGSVMQEASTGEISDGPWAGSARFSHVDGCWQIEQLVPQEQK